jgi:hypothetical protein
MLSIRSCLQVRYHGIGSIPSTAACLPRTALRLVGQRLVPGS